MPADNVAVTSTADRAISSTVSMPFTPLRSMDEPIIPTQPAPLPFFLGAASNKHPRQGT